MNRRKFIRAFVGAVATVAIGLKLAEPVYDGVISEVKIFDRALSDEEIDALHSGALKYKASMRFSPPYTDWRAVYGSPG